MSAHLDLYAGHSLAQQYGQPRRFMLYEVERRGMGAHTMVQIARYWVWLCLSAAVGLSSCNSSEHKPRVNHRD